MDTLSALVVLAGSLGVLFAAINLVNPFRRLGIGTRRRAAMLLIASFGLVVAGMEILGPDRQAASEFMAAAERTGPDMEKSATVGADSAQTIPVEVGVVANRLVLQSNMDGRDLLLAIDTDLPDETEVIVSVGRIYHEVGSDTAYSRDYFSDRGSLSEWRKPRRIPIDDDA